MLAANLYWARCLRRDANREVEAFAANFRPPLTRANCTSTVSCVYKNPGKHRKGLMSYRAIADKLDVTPDEATAISDMLQKSFPTSSRFDDGTRVPRVAPAGKRDMEALLRRIEIRRIVEDCGAVPSCRKLQRMLLGGRNQRGTCHGDGRPQSDAACGHDVSSARGRGQVRVCRHPFWEIEAGKVQ